MTSPLDPYRKPRARKGGRCARCGGLAEARVAVTLEERRRNENARNGWSYPAIDSRSVTLCAECAVVVYEAAKGPLPT